MFDTASGAEKDSIVLMYLKDGILSEIPLYLNAKKTPAKNPMKYPNTSPYIGARAPNPSNASTMLIAAWKNASVVVTIVMLFPFPSPTNAS